MHRTRGESGYMAGRARRERLEMAIPFWTYVVLIVAGLAVAIAVGLTHN